MIPSIKSMAGFCFATFGSLFQNVSQKYLFDGSGGSIALKVVDHLSATGALPSEPTDAELVAINLDQPLESSLLSLNNIMEALEVLIKTKQTFEMIPEEEESEETVWAKYAAKSLITQTSGEGLLLVAVENDPLVTAATSYEKKLAKNGPLILYSKDDKHCSHSDAEMRDLLRRLEVNDLNLMEHWIHCPDLIRDRAVEAFLSSASEDTIKIFFHMNPELAATYGSPTHQDSLVRGVLQRQAPESIMSLLAFFEPFQLFKDAARNPHLANWILERGIQVAAEAVSSAPTEESRLEAERIADQFIALVRRILSPGQQLPLMRHTCGGDYSVLHLAARPDVPQKFIRFIAPLVRDRRARYLSKCGGKKGVSKAEFAFIDMTANEIAQNRPDYQSIQSLLQ